MTVTVRGARADDLTFVAQDGYVPDTVVLRKIEADEVFVAEEDGASVGYLRLEYLWSIQPYVALIRVLEPHRGRGAGRALLAYVEGRLRTDGHSVLYSSSQVDEPEAQSWHRAMGFRESGMIAGINAGGVGEVFFRKEL